METKIPKNHDKILEAWKVARMKVKVAVENNDKVLSSILEQKARCEAEAEAEAKAEKEAKNVPVIIGEEAAKILSLVHTDAERERRRRRDSDDRFLD